MTADPATAISDSAAPPARGGVALRRIGLDSRAYRDMLDDYCCWRLGLRPDLPADADLRDAILETAGHQFAFVAFLAERCQRGKEDADSLRRAPGSATADGTPPDADDRPETDSPRGESLYRHWLAGLHLEYGHKLAERMRAVLALLGAAEAAHAWVFGAGRLAHPVTGAVLTPLPERFEGLPLAVLQTLLLLEPPPRPLPAAGPSDADPPGAAPDRLAEDRYNPALLLTLQQLQGVLSVHRGGSGTSRFRIGLKDLGPALGRDEHVKPLLERAPARMASAALDAVEAIAEALDGPPDTADDRLGQRPSRHPDWPLFEALAPLLEALVVAAGSETVERRWGQLRETAERLLAVEDEALEGEGRADLRLPGLSLLVAWGVPNSLSRIAQASKDSPESSNRFAGRLSNRSLAHEDNGDLAAAIADGDAAVEIGEGIRDRQRAAGGEAAWSVPYRNDLAMVLQTRGNYHQGTGDLAAAIADYDAAVDICEGIRDRLHADGGEVAWGIPYRSNLEAALSNRGLAHMAKGDLTAASADYDAAAEICKGIRDSLRAAGGEAAWSIPYRYDLARVVQNRGNAHQTKGHPAAAIADYDAALEIAEGIRDRLRAAGGEAAWSVPDRNQLAMVLQNRGKAHAANDNLAAAFADYDAALEIVEGIRDRLRAAGGEAAWSIPYRNVLAMVQQNRGIVHHGNGDLAAAIADYDAAVEIREGIRDGLLAGGDEAAWSIPYRNDLAMVLHNRGAAHADTGDLAAAIADYNAAVEIRAGIRDGLRAAGGEAAWSMPYRNAFATVLANRGAAHAAKGNLAAAIIDYDWAVEIGKGIRDGLRAAGGEAAWTAPLRVDLASMYANRARALGPARGSADWAAVLAIADGLKRAAQAEVLEYCVLIALHWARRNPFATIASLRAQGPAVFWSTVALILLAPVLVPLLALTRGLSRLQQRIAVRRQRRQARSNIRTRASNPRRSEP